MIGLTKAQRECLEFIQTFISAHQYSPSYTDMMEGLRLHSKSGIHRLVTALEARGFIRRIPGHSRSVAIVDSDSCPHCGKALTSLKEAA